MAELVIREAESDDAPQIMDLIKDLAIANGEDSPITEAYIDEFLIFPGNGILLAEEDGEILGLVSYSVRPNLYCAGDIARIEELVIRGDAQGRGIGAALIDELLHFLESIDCVKVAVATGRDDDVAQRFYRTHGLGEVKLLLEKKL